MIELLYLIAAACFIVGLKQMSSPRTARRGNIIAAIGMLIAVVVTLVSSGIISWWVIIAGLVVGSLIGAVLALKVQMTGMPELVAAFNGFGGIASTFVALSELHRTGAQFSGETATTVGLSLLVGTLTFTGSFVAYGKLAGKIPGRPIGLPGGNLINLALLVVAVVFAVLGAVMQASWPYWIVVAIAAILGVLGVLPVGGADMPVIISLLNSFSGVAASMAGFVVGNSALIIGGALVGAAGMILTLLMADAMNRSIANVLFARFGGTTASGPIGDKPVKKATPDDVAIALGYAESVLVVPGYGMAVAQAQHAVRDLANALEERGISVGYAIHPVAGRMPGHMNVLLAEADVPYDQLYDLEQSNPKFPLTDVVLVIGANDVVNPAAREDPESPIYGMPILDVDKAKTVVVMKRSLSPGFAGIDNPLFYKENNMMLFADGKNGVESIISALDNV